MSRTESATTAETRLTDVVRAVGGWPINLEAVARVLDAADALLPEGRDTGRPLTAAEVAALVLVAGGLEADPAGALVDLARDDQHADFVALAGAVGVPPAAVATLWAGTRRRLGRSPDAPARGEDSP